MENPEGATPAQPDETPSPAVTPPATPTDARERRSAMRPRNGNGAPAGAPPMDAPQRTQAEAQGVPGRKYYTIIELTEMSPKQLLEAAAEFKVSDVTAASPKDEVMMRILQAQTEAQGNIFAQGILEIVEDGFGFLRRSNLLPSPQDVYVSSSQVRRIGLRTGDVVTGQTRPPKD